MRLVHALNSPSGVQIKSLVRSYFSGVNSLADTYQRAAGFGVTSAHSKRYMSHMGCTYLGPYSPRANISFHPLVMGDAMAPGAYGVDSGS